jgi:hypothetical protein
MHDSIKLKGGSLAGETLCLGESWVVG